MNRFLLVEGPGRGTVFETGDEGTIGRGRQCAIRLLGRHISRVHARIDRRPEGLVVADAESRNGIFVNGRKVKHHRLERDDEIEIGEFILVFEPTFDFSSGIPAQRPRTTARIQETLGDPFADSVSDSQVSSDYPRLRAIVDTLRLLHSIDDEKGALKAFLERILAHIPAKRGFVMLTEGAGKLIPVAKSAPKGMEDFYVSNMIHHQVSREHRALIGSDLGKEGALLGKSVTILCAPLVTGGRYSGFLYLDGPSETTTFRHQDLRFAAILATFAAAVVSKKRAPASSEEESFLPIWEKKISLADHLAQIEKECLTQALDHAEGNHDLAAEMIGTDPENLREKLRRYGLVPDAKPAPSNWKSVEP